MISPILSLLFISLTLNSIPVTSFPRERKSWASITERYTRELSYSYMPDSKRAFTSNLPSLATLPNGVNLPIGDTRVTVSPGSAPICFDNSLPIMIPRGSALDFFKTLREPPFIIESMLITLPAVAGSRPLRIAPEILPSRLIITWL